MYLDTVPVDDNLSDCGISTRLHTLTNHIMGKSLLQQFNLTKSQGWEHAFTWNTGLTRSRDRFVEIVWLFQQPRQHIMLLINACRGIVAQIVLIFMPTEQWWSNPCTLTCWHHMVRLTSWFVKRLVSPVRTAMWALSNYEHITSLSWHMPEMPSRDYK